MECDICGKKMFQIDEKTFKKIRNCPMNRNICDDCFELAKQVKKSNTPMFKIFLMDVCSVTNASSKIIKTFVAKDEYEKNKIINKIKKENKPIETSDWDTIIVVEKFNKINQETIYL
jgi:uncharacterized protein YlaI